MDSELSRRRDAGQIAFAADYTGGLSVSRLNEFDNRVLMATQ